MYILYVFFSTRNYISVIKKIRKAQSAHNPYGDAFKALKIKYNMMMCMMVGNLLFCLCQIIRFGIVNLVSDEIDQIKF